MANNKCKECGCTCKKCISSDHDVQLHVEIENLKQRLFEKENHIVTMETNFLNEANKFPNGEVMALREELLTWQEKYKRLYEAHRRVQRVNQGLEDKLLKLVDVCETDKNTLTKDVATLSHKLAEANYTIKKLTEDNDRYRTDVSLAIQFLQCKQSNYVAHKFDSLPQEVQSQVSTYMVNKRKQPEEKKSPPEIKSIKVPIPTFPPTAMVYSIPKSPNIDRKVEQENDSSPAVDIVSAAIMAKVLEERQRERALTKHCDTCTCAKNLKIIYDHEHHSIATQTGDYKEMLCLRCNESVQVNSTGMKIVRSLDAKSKSISYPNDLGDCNVNSNNIVKVQPNNFLIKSKSNSNNSSLIDLTSNATNSSVSPKNVINPNMHVIGSELNVRIHNKSDHHHLCDKTSPTYEIITEKAESEKNLDKTSAKNASSENLKGPRYCSMRVQSGSKNILLDNAHNNIAPVLYTRSHKIKREDPPKTHESSNADSIQSDNSAHNQQRVAEWIQNNLDNDVSSSDNSRSDDKKKYAEMEENVKRFLFGESEFLKTVEIGKWKYQNRETDDCTVSNSSSQKNSHTETEI